METMGETEIMGETDRGGDRGKGKGGKVKYTHGDKVV